MLCIFVLLIIMTNVYGKHHKSKHHKDKKSEVDYGNIIKFDMSGDPNELLPSPCVNGETMTRQKHQDDLDSWIDCPVQREQVMKINEQGFDIDGDGNIDMDECVLARRFYLEKWIERAIAESCDKVFEHCDCDGDGLISTEDFLNARFTCLRNCKAGVMINHYIGSRMVDGKAFGEKQEGI